MRYLVLAVTLVLVLGASAPAAFATDTSYESDLLASCTKAFRGADTVRAENAADRQLTAKILTAQHAVMSRVEIAWLRGYSPIVFIVSATEWDAAAVFAGNPLADDIRGLGICITDGVIRGLPVEMLSAVIAHETGHLTSGMAVGMRVVAWEHEMDVWAAGIVGSETVVAMLKYVLANAPQLKTGTVEAHDAIAELETRIRLLEEKFAH